MLAPTKPLTTVPDMHAQAIEQAVESIFAQSSLHAKQITSIAHAVIGVSNAAFAGVGNIGRAEAAARQTSPKHAIKQFDRFLSNEKIRLEEAECALVRFELGNRSRVTVSLDWTEYADGTRHRIVLSLVTRHGRATPLAWKTVTAEELTERRNEHENRLLRAFKCMLPNSVREVRVLADRGFGDIKLYDMLKAELGFDYVIRFRKCITVRDAAGTARTGGEWVPSNGRALLIPHAKVTGDKFEVEAVVAVKRAAMKEEWLLATSLKESADAVVRLYGRRFTIEENFRDEKDWRFGLGSLYVNIDRPDRRDRLTLVIAIATVLLTLLGHAGEQLGLDRGLRANTVRSRTHSFFRQGREYFRGALGKLRNAAERLWEIFWEAFTHQQRWVDEMGLI
jgi:hypothetical protein